MKGDLGLKIGLEIHQRLKTQSKLFCSCNSKFPNEEASGEIKRKLRAVPGELGEMDPAALYELLKRKEFKYKLYPKSTCLVETDSEPPHTLDEEALEIALQVAKMLGCEVPEEIHPMRKTVIDGSNTAGFQRTMLVGLDGKLGTSEGPVGIQNLCLEEESAQILGEENGTVEYGLNRLGIPLVEIGTTPEIKNPEHAAEVAEKIGKLLRSTRRVQRGIGTIRQDVNVSIERGARIEIKGLQELGLVKKAVKLEVERQLSLLEIMEELNERNSTVPENTSSVKDIFEASDSSFADKLAGKAGVKAFKLENFSGLLAKEISGDRTFGEELSEYAEAHGAGGILHSDEDLSKYGLEDEFEKIGDRLEASEKDVVVVIRGGEDLEEAVSSVKERVLKATEQVPQETRDANPDGTTSYSRPLPGEARMYPETDVPPIPVSEERLEQIEVPETLEETMKRLTEEYDLSKHLAKEVQDSRFFDLFEEMANKLELDPSTIADCLTLTLKDLKKREGLSVENLDKSSMRSLLEALGSGDISKDAVPTILKKVLKEGVELERALEEFETISEKELKRITGNVLDEREELLEDERAHKKLMGPVMEEVGGKISGKKVSKELKKQIEERRED